MASFHDNFIISSMCVPTLIAAITCGIYSYQIVKLWYPLPANQESLPHCTKFFLVLITREKKKVLKEKEFLELGSYSWYFCWNTVINILVTDWHNIPSKHETFLKY